MTTSGYPNEAADGNGFGDIESIKPARIKPAINFDSSLAPFILKYRIPVGFNFTMRASEQTCKGSAGCTSPPVEHPRPRLDFGHMLYHIPMDTLSEKE